MLQDEYYVQPDLQQCSPMPNYLGVSHITLKVIIFWIGKNWIALLEWICIIDVIH